VGVITGYPARAWGVKPDCFRDVISAGHSRIPTRGKSGVWVRSVLKRLVFEKVVQTDFRKKKVHGKSRKPLISLVELRGIEPLAS
jgi:hypothetical protein